MERSDVPELHYIALLETIPSILDRGILSRRRATRLEPPSIANEEILARRASIRVPRGRPLPHYVNLYFDARNAMLSRRRDRWREIGIVRVGHEVLDLPGVVISDRNAAAFAARFYPSPGGLRHLDAEDVFAEWWDQSLEARQLRMAEVLVPDRVAPDYIRGVYVMDEECAMRLAGSVDSQLVAVNRYVFFQEARGDS